MTFSDAWHIRQINLYVSSPVNVDVYLGSESNLVMSIDRNTGFDYKIQSVLVPPVFKLLLVSKGFEKTVTLSASPNEEDFIGAELLLGPLLTEQEIVASYDRDEALQTLSGGCTSYAFIQLSRVGTADDLDTLIGKIAWLRAQKQDVDTTYQIAWCAVALANIAVRTDTRLAEIYQVIERAYASYPAKKSYGYMFEAALRKLKENLPAHDVNAVGSVDGPVSDDAASGDARHRPLYRQRYGTEYALGKEIGAGTCARAFILATDQKGRRAVVKAFTLEYGVEAAKGFRDEEAGKLSFLETKARGRTLFPVLYSKGDVFIGGEALPAFCMSWMDGVPLSAYAESMRAGLEAALSEPGVAPLESGAAFSEPVAVPSARTVLLVAKAALGPLGVLESAGIAHRDLNPGNLLLCLDDEGDPDSAEIIDFGTAALPGMELTRFQKVGDYVIEGASAYAAPEVYDVRSQYHDEWARSPKSNMWALGKLLLYLRTGSPEYRRAGAHFEGSRETDFGHAPGDTEAELAALKYLVQRCLSVDPAKRPDVKAALEIAAGNAPVEPDAADGTAVRRRTAVRLRVVRAGRLRASSADVQAQPGGAEDASPSSPSRPPLEEGPQIKTPESNY